MIDNGYALLRRTRDITHGWMRQVLPKLQTITGNEDAVGELQQRACEMAAICRATYDVDAGDHRSALLSSSADIAVLVECGIVIHDNAPRDLKDSSSHLRRLLQRDSRLAHSLESMLARLIHDDNGGLDDAITSVWPAYRPGAGGWQHLPKPNERWITSSTDPEPNRRSQHVQYNLLTGRLLIDGKPLGRLPHEILKHKTYQRIFGQVCKCLFPCVD